ncbi:MAG: MoxR family ATPase [Myxococcota bacterium]
MSSMKIPSSGELYAQIGALSTKIVERGGTTEKAKALVDALATESPDARPQIAALIVEYKQLDGAIQKYNAEHPEAPIQLNEALSTFAAKALESIVVLDAKPNNLGKELRAAVLSEVGKAVVGNEKVIELMLIAQLCRGHFLMEGPVGAGKTHLANSFSKVEGLGYKRQQFVSDLLPADVTGTEMENHKTKQWEPKFGAVAETDLYHADELNRAPPKAQGALLEAMGEGQITIAGQTRQLSEFFMVMATQNPEHHAGTFPLTEANKDRFMFKVLLGRPTREEQAQIMSLQLDGAPKLKQVVDADKLRAARQEVQKVLVEKPMREMIIEIVRATWPGESKIPGVEGKLAGEGASERATGAILQGARAHAFLRGRHYVMPEDVRAVAPYALNHRIEVRPELLAGRTDPTLEIIEAILNHVEQNLS